MGGRYASGTEIGADRQVEVELLDESMRPVPPDGMPYSGPVGPPVAIVLPNHSRIRYKVSAGGCGVPPGGVAVCFVEKGWFIPDEDARTSYVRGVLRRDGRDEGGGKWIGRLALTATRVDRQPE
jgi:hypothetical protein